MFATSEIFTGHFPARPSDPGLDTSELGLCIRRLFRSRNGTSLSPYTSGIMALLFLKQKLFPSQEYQKLPSE